MNEDTDGSDGDAAGDEAIEWFVRMRAEGFSAADRTAFEAWRDRGAENAEAFEEVLHMYGHLAGMSPQRAERLARPRRRGWAVATAAVAVACLALIVPYDDIAASVLSDHHAGVGEQKLVTLDDGSRVHLDSRSSIAVHFSAAERRLTLLGGEAWFEVAPNPARPFVVEAGGGSVTAIGTAFDIALETSGARVTVTQHSVNVTGGGQSFILPEGRQTTFGARAGVGAPSSVDIDSVTAWRRGKLIVERRPLGEVLATIAKYRRGLVYCVNAATCARRVTGVFGSDDPLQSLREIETSLGLNAVHLTNYLILIH